MNENALESVLKGWTPPKVSPCNPGVEGEGEWEGEWKPLPDAYPDWRVEKRPDPLTPIADAREAAAQNRNESPLLSDECADTLRGWWSGAALPTGTCSCGVGHFHCYKISSGREWKTWRNSKHGHSSPHHWWCNSIKQAADHYSWTPYKGGSFNHLSAALQSAIRLGNQSLTEIVCCKILDWGGVFKGRLKSTDSIKWINGSSNLRQDIINSAANLIPYSSWGSGWFGDISSGLVPMNSGTTKIFSAAALDLSGGVASPRQDVLIYDGRVGSALGLLARRLLYPVAIRGSAQPVGYLFLRSDGGISHKRNPSMSIPVITFPPMNGHSGIFSKALHVALKTSNRDEVRAWYARRSAELIQYAIAASGPHPDFIKAEKALFMLGCDVKYLCTGLLRPVP
jgi:hypothetical protein